MHDFAVHNAEVKEVWEAYRQRKPIRTPIVFGINPRYTTWRPAANPRGITFERYFNDPQTMLERQLEHQCWIRYNVWQDTEMGLPEVGWGVYVDFQNTYESAWLGGRLFYREDQVPDIEPILTDDRKHLLFDQGVPDPFSGGLMRRNWEFYDYFQNKKAEGWTYLGRPIADVQPTGQGTDGPVTIACNLRGATAFLTDLLADTDYALQLLDFLTEAIITRILAYRRRFGQPEKTQSWGFADDSIEALSTETYRALVLPFHRRLIETFSLGGPNSIHLCGDATHHFPLLRDELNIQSFDTGYPINFAQVRQALGPEVEILGGPSVPFLVHATPMEVEEEVRRILDSGVRAGGRFVLREGNNVAPDVPLENLHALYEAGKRWGSYQC